MKYIAGLLALFAFAVSAHEKPKPQPKPETVVVKERDSNYKGALIIVAAVSGIAFYVYQNQEKTKKVALEPTQDGRGAKVAFEWRH